MIPIDTYRPSATCDTCIWHDQCAADAACEDYSPADDSLDVFTYSAILRENMEEYGDFLKEMGIDCE